MIKSGFRHEHKIRINSGSSDSKRRSHFRSSSTNMMSYYILFNLWFSYQQSCRSTRYLADECFRDSSIGVFRLFFLFDVNSNLIITIAYEMFKKIAISQTSPLGKIKYEKYKKIKITQNIVFLNLGIISTWRYFYFSILHIDGIYSINDKYFFYQYSRYLFSVHKLTLCHGIVVLHRVLHTFPQQVVVLS